MLKKITVFLLLFGAVIFASIPYEHRTCIVVELDESEMPKRTRSVFPVATKYNPATVDVMIIYSPAVAAKMGNTKMERRIIAESVIERANQAFVNSEIYVTYRLVYDTIVTGFPDTVSLKWIYNEFGNHNDFGNGLFSQKFGADILSYWCEKIGGNAAGLAFLHSGFNACAYDYVINGYTFEHEMGHNFGAHHDRATVTYYDGYNDSLSKDYRYGYVLRDGNTYQGGTIMSYEHYSRIHYFSNPDVKYNGFPTGVSRNNPFNAANWRKEGPADNASKINEEAHRIANWSPEKYKGEIIVNYAPNGTRLSNISLSSAGLSGFGWVNPNHQLSGALKDWQPYHQIRNSTGDIFNISLKVTRKTRAFQQITA